MRNKIILALVFIIIITLGGIYGQLLTAFWTYIIDTASNYWIPILIVCGIGWFIKTRIDTMKSKEIKKKL